MVFGGVAPLILNVGFRWRWLFDFVSRPLYPLEKYKRLVGTQTPFGRCREERNIFPLSGIESKFLGCQIQQRSRYTDDAS